MKKLLLLLLLSLAFIGSANANSIKGAFGYKLGTVMKDVPTTYYKFTSYGTDFYNFSSSKKFIPKKPLPSLENYIVRTTFTDKKIHTIAGSTTKKYSNNRRTCIGDLDRILSLLRARYGKFTKDYKFTNRNNGYDSNGDFWSIWNERYIYQDKTRKIILSCESDSRDSNYLSLKYTDDNLRSRAWDESDSLEKQKIIAESDYDL